MKKNKLNMQVEKEIFNIYNFGDYRLGLTNKEINMYLQKRTGKNRIKRLRAKFNKVAGINTMSIGPQGQALMYRHDILRFTNLILEGRSTYFD